MIHIFVTRNYSKETLKDLLMYINTNVDRELTYGINSDYDNDVEVTTDKHLDEERVLDVSGMNIFKGDLCIIIEEQYCKAFLNGHHAIIRSYVEERF